MASSDHLGALLSSLGRFCPALYASVVASTCTKQRRHANRPEEQPLVPICPWQVAGPGESVTSGTEGENEANSLRFSIRLQLCTSAIFPSVPLHHAALSF